jgi:hypothetical protein
MVRVFETTTAHRNLIADAVYDLINQWGKVCKLFYPPKLVECNNCSRSTYRTGGPMPFNFGVCPLCKGSSNIKASETTEDITMLIDIRPKPYILALAGIDIRNPDGLILSKGFVKDLPKIKQCNFMQLMDIDGYGHQRFKLYGEPFDLYNIAQSKYFTAFWKQYG